jgi:4-diphosphocytidyl-2C-methyl-D-erythritol kinase
MVFKPEYSISTKEAYGALVKDSFESEVEALKRLKSAEENTDYCNSVLYNSFLKTTRSKYLALGILLDLLNSKGFPSLMSGSGSACFSLLSPGNDAKESHNIREIIMNSLGENVFLKPSFII